MASEWALRLHEPGGRIVGAGILLTGGHVLTCAHVVNAALNRTDGVREFPTAEVEVCFPSVPGATVHARVVDGGWHPIDSSGRMDVAVLRLTSPAPKGMRPVRMAVAADGGRARDVFAVGYPARYDTGVEAQAVIAGVSPGTGNRQLEARATTGHRIARGFSGAGVVDRSTETVLGLVIQEDTDERTRVAFMLPAEAIAELLPPDLRALLRVEMLIDTPAVPDNLPTALPDFTGRDAELEILAARLEEGGEALAIHAIDGMGGIGKTSLAVAFARRVASRFRDGRLFIDLQAHTAGEQPVEPEEALRRLLGMLNVAPATKPTSEAEWAELWRAELSGRRVLVVLDNAASTEQVAPLLPGSSTSLVLITSRRRLDGLHTRGVDSLNLDVLPEDAALALFGKVVGAEREAAEPEAAARVVGLCGRLPLAIRLVAARLAARPGWSMADMAEELADAESRLAAMQVENLSVRAAFELSYRLLAKDESSLFRSLGLHPPGEFGLPVATALGGTSRSQGRDVMERLVDYSLVREPGRHRYAMHDLMREYARERGSEQDPRPARKKAVTRALDFYLHTALRANNTLLPHRPIADEVTKPPPASPKIETEQEAVAWFDLERENLMASRTMASEYDLPPYLWRIPRAISHYLGLRSDLNDSGGHFGLGLSLAGIHNDQRAMVDLTARIGDVNHTLGNHASAINGFMGAREIYQRLKDPASAADMLNRAGVCYRMSGDNDRALAEHNEALAEHNELGDAYGRAESHYMIAMVHRVRGRFDEALDHHRQAIELYRGIDYPLGEARSLANIGVIHRMREDYDTALGFYPRALQIYRRTGDRRGIANTLNNMSSALVLADRAEKALPLLDEAIGIFNSIMNTGGVADVRRVLARVHSKAERWDEADRELTLSLETYEQNRTAFGRASALAQRATVRRHAGRSADALRDAAESVRLFREESPSDSGESAALLELARCRLVLGDPGTARRHAEDALARSANLGTARTAGIREFIDGLVPVDNLARGTTDTSVPDEEPPDAAG